MQNGVYVKNLSLANLKVKQLYIKWNEKLDLSIKEVTLLDTKKNKNSTINLEQINKSLHELYFFNNWFDSVIIEKMTYNDISATLNYKSNEDGFFTATSPEFSLKSSINVESDLLNIKVDSFKDSKRKIDVSGNIILNTNRYEFTSSLDVNINDDVVFNLLAHANQNRLFYKFNALKNIKDITHTMKLLDLDKDVKYWAYEAIKMSYGTLNAAYGWIDYKNTADAYKNLYASAIGHDLDYTYNKKLDPVRSKQTDLEFKDGVLYIRPQGAYSYNFYLDKSWLKIDFTKKEELLTLFLLFDAQLNKDILHVLSSYKIDVPFLQNRGKVKTNLKLTVNLRTIEVDAKGDFFTKDGNFTYSGLNFNAYDTYLLLDNYDISIKNMLVKYDDIATASVDANYNAKKSEGKIDFNIKRINFSELNLSLNNKTPLNLTYTISPKQDNISIKNSTWKFNDTPMSIESINIPFNLKDPTINIPATLVKIQDTASGYISGISSLRTKKTDLDVDLLSFNYEGFELSQSNTPIKVLYDKKLSIQSTNPINFTLGNLDCSLEKTLIDVRDNKLYLKDSILNVEGIGRTDFIGHYDLKEKYGLLELQNLKIENKQLGDLFFSNEIIDLDIVDLKDAVKISAPKLNLDFEQKGDAWDLNIKGLDWISKNSKFLQRYNVTNGSLKLYQDANNTDKINLLANIKYPYKLLVNKNEPIEDYTISGSFDKNAGKTALNINDLVEINIKKDVRVKTKDIGLNLNALFDFVNTINSTTVQSNPKNIMLSAENSYLYISQNRHIISDFINLQYFDKILTVQLQHADGRAGLKFEENKFHIYGENFNDKFMENLFVFSKFSGGVFDFSIDGTTNEFDGIFHVKNTTVLDYKVLNNVLAFVNTVPSLITFSVPGYNSKGLKAINAYMNFHAKDNVYNISDIYLNSQEIDILGRGTANFNNNSIDLQLNLKTDLGSTVSKVPLVGYVLLDGNTISTTLSITGDVYNPDVKSLLARDIVVAPFNIIKRVLLLPYHLFSDKNATTENNSTKVEDNTTKE